MIPGLAKNTSFSGPTGMIIDGIAASEAIDSSGEVLDVSGCDITSLENGDGLLNYEHHGEDSKGSSGNDNVGHIIYAKKIFKDKDCADKRQKMYWDMVKLPYIYIRARLYDGSGHPNAIALAAQIRDHVANNEKILCRYSIEGSTLEKDGNRLKRSIARKVAVTVKPCNKSCASGVILDPNSPFKNKKEDHTDSLIDSILARNEVGLETKFSALTVAFDPIVKEELPDLGKRLIVALGKTLSAATMAPLMPEHLTKRLQNTALAVIRDYDKPFIKEEFRATLKHQLPEADDSFLDHFANLADDYHVRKGLLRKADVAKPRKTRVAPVVDEGGMSVQGKPIKPNPHLAKPFFDEGSGVLHTPGGSFPMYIPSRDSNPDAGATFKGILEDPKVTEFHDRALENWAKVNSLLKNGQLPPEIVMHGTLFSQMSTHTEVPVQELMYAHLVDAMKHKGISAIDPRFGSEVGPEWLGRDKPNQLPETGKDYFSNLGPQIRIGKLNDRNEYYSSYNRDAQWARRGGEGNMRQVGEVKSFALANNKLANASQYHGLHKHLVDLVNRHRENAQAAVQELMSHKDLARKHAGKRQRALANGQELGPYPGPDVLGLAPKTARYMYGMLGGSNVVVPDTHFTRHLFGLSRGADQSTIDHIKKVLWSPLNTGIMNGIDRYYAKHHDAVKHLRDHPRFGGLFPDNESAVFPAFWKHWLAIVPHEKSRGMASFGSNSTTDHTPYWEAINPYVQKNENDSWRTAEETATQHHNWVEQFGEIPAMTLYYRYAIPKLLQRGGF